MYLLLLELGITPFLAMAAKMKKKSKSFELHYAAPSKELCVFYPFSLFPITQMKLLLLLEKRRKMTTEFMKEQPIETHVYFCGPETMVREYAEAAKTYGYPEKSIHFELFTPPDMGPMHAFEVKLNKSNQVLQVPEGEKLLDFLLQHNIDAPYSCKIGGCGACRLMFWKGK